MSLRKTSRCEEVQASVAKTVYKSCSWQASRVTANQHGLEVLQTCRQTGVGPTACMIKLPDLILKIRLLQKECVATASGAKLEQDLRCGVDCQLGLSAHVRAEAVTTFSFCCDFRYAGRVPLV